tara:strand:+ start:419 stop:805 length:387 start_codon:yes stop_codon:yes gene_type:complete
MLPREDLKELLVTAFVLLSIDLAYIYSKSDYFGRYFETIQNSPMKFQPFKAAMAYILLVIGLYYFVIREKKPMTYAFLLGVFVYGVYDLTNYATLEKWTLRFVVTDTLWGGVVFSLSTYIIYKILNNI